jgi:hypothetical protein
MKQQIIPSSDSVLFFQKQKNADEKKFHLRKVIYEIDKLSYEKGTRSGDYLIREKISAINEELKSYDDKLRLCDFNSKSYLPISEEILPFFEQRYLEKFFLHEMIGQLKQELINQNNTDFQHNIEHQGASYKRNVNNPYRDELKKDLISFESKLSTSIVPFLNEFLNDLNHMLFMQRFNKNIDEWSISHITGDIDIVFKNHINYFFTINTKITKAVPSVDEMAALTDILLNGSGLKARLLHLKNFNETKLKSVVFDSAKEFSSKIAARETSFRNRAMERIANKENSGQTIQDEFEEVLNKLRLLTEYKKTINISDYAGMENLSGSRSNRYLYYSPDTGEIKLKDVADYLKDSLIFINEWLLVVLKNDRDLLSMVKSLIDCLPAETRFYDLFETANIISAGLNNQKKNFWGDKILYITREIASELLGIIEYLCVELKDSFVRIIFDVELNKSSVSKVFAKKVNIIYDSFENARRKIMSAVKQLDKI